MLILFFYIVSRPIVIYSFAESSRLNNKDARRKTQEEDTGRNDAG